MRKIKTKYKKTNHQIFLKEYSHEFQQKSVKIEK